MTMPTLVDEWTAAARTLASNHTSVAAQRHARFKVFNLPNLSKWKRATPAIMALHKPIALLMMNMRNCTGAAGTHAAAALAMLADALEAAPQEQLPDAEAPRVVPYNPGVGA